MTNQYTHSWDDLDARMLLRLPDELKERIEVRAERDGISQGEVIRRVLWAGV